MKIRLFITLLLFFSLIALSGCTFTNGPRAWFTADPASGLPPLEVSFDAGGSHSPNREIVSYKWCFGAGNTADGTRVEHTFWEKGAHKVTLTITDSAGREDMTTRIIKALGRAPHARFTVSPSIVRVNRVVSFDASASSDADGTIVQWDWSFGDGAIASGEDVTHIYTRIGTVRVTLTVIDNNGERDSVSKNIRVTGCPTC